MYFFTFSQCHFSSWTTGYSTCNLCCDLQDTVSVSHSLWSVFVRRNHFVCYICRLTTQLTWRKNSHKLITVTLEYCRLLGAVTEFLAEDEWTDQKSGRIRRKWIRALNCPTRCVVSAGRPQRRWGDPKNDTAHMHGNEKEIK